MSTLANIEKQLKISTLSKLRTAKLYSWQRVFLVQFIYTPFGISSFLFIPFFGQVLTVMCLALGIIYVYLTRSLISLAAGLAGTICSALLLSLFFVYLSATALVAMYALLALAVIVSIAYIVGVSGALLSLMQQEA